MLLRVAASLAMSLPVAAPIAGYLTWKLSSKRPGRPASKRRVPASPGASANSSAELPALSPLSADASIELRRRLAAAFFLQARDEPELRARATVAHPPLPTPSQSAIRQPSGEIELKPAGVAEEHSIVMF